MRGGGLLLKEEGRGGGPQSAFGTGPPESLIRPCVNVRLTNLKGLARGFAVTTVVSFLQISQYLAVAVLYTYRIWIIIIGLLLSFFSVVVCIAVLT